VKGFSHLAAPFTYLTKKGAFRWTEEAQRTFNMMKEVMSTCPILALPDFTQPFVLECDAIQHSSHLFSAYQICNNTVHEVRSISLYQFCKLLVVVLIPIELVIKRISLVVFSC
jgi:hypothetical protein